MVSFMAARIAFIAMFYFVDFSIPLINVLCQLSEMYIVTIACYIAYKNKDTEEEVQDYERLITKN